MSNVIFRTSPSKRLQGALRVPGDKSISHRSIMLGALAEGVSHIEGFLEGEDCLATVHAFRKMGVHIEGPYNTKVTIEGVGLHGLSEPQGPLDMGNSGTSMRLMSGLLSGQRFSTHLTGDHSLTQRPMKRVITPLRLMGADIQSAEDGTPPLSITKSEGLSGIHYDLPIASAQVKSCVLLAGLYAEGTTSVTEPGPTRDHTERMLRSFGWPVETVSNHMQLSGGGVLTATTIDVPADISSAAFFMVAACIAEDAEITLQHVGMNPTRTGVIDILKLMGADIRITNQKQVGDEPVADIVICSSVLQGIDIPEELVPLAIDEFPVLFVAASMAKGTTRLTGAEELRVKESDRIQAMADGLKVLGVELEPTADGIIIQGGKEIQGGVVDSYGDHRIAMAFAVAGLCAKEAIEIHHCNNVNTSFPDFVRLAKTVGLDVTSSV